METLQKINITDIIESPWQGRLLDFGIRKIKEMESIIDSADIKTFGRIFQTVTKTFILRYADVSDVESAKLAKEDSVSCNSVVCYTFSFTGEDFTVATVDDAASYCSTIDRVGGHLAKTYNFKGSRVNF